MSLDFHERIVGLRSTKKRSVFNSRRDDHKSQETKERGARLDRECISCGKSFWVWKSQVTARVPRLACSVKCSMDARRRPTLLKDCLGCGNSFSTIRAAAKFCSPVCASKNQVRNFKRRPPLNCKQCGKTYQLPKGRHSTAFCSRACSILASRKVKIESCAVYFPRCRRCSRIFTAQKKSIYFCSAECRKPPYLPKPIRTIQCASCACEVKTRPGRGKTKRYCDSCAEARFRDRKNADKRLRQARRTDAFVAPVYRRAIYERDGWKCGICHKSVNPKLEVPHPLAKTIDHIVPLSKGGTHEPRNVQLAHFICNSKRSDKGPAQLRLME